MPRTPAAQARYDALKAAGRCVACGGESDGKTKCHDCRKKDKDARAERTKSRKEFGVCVACPNEAKPGCSLCEECIQKRSETSSRHYERRKEAGTCSYCSDPPAPGHSMCERHLEHYKEYRRQIKMEVLNAYGGPKCAVCGESDVDVLEIDHEAGGGCRHRKELNMEGAGHQFYLWLRRNKFPKGYRVLCSTHNRKAHVSKT